MGVHGDHLHDGTESPQLLFMFLYLRFFFYLRFFYYSLIPLEEFNHIFRMNAILCLTSHCIKTKNVNH